YTALSRGLGDVYKRQAGAGAGAGAGAARHLSLLSSPPPSYHTSVCVYKSPTLWRPAQRAEKPHEDRRGID
ncbi:MAG: hypothetical protein QUU85_04915, partial [Candidatus Eisenbacteria bacterium]|nr:hypothetical protein [Candidatus Eisenbacteria bacterium]